MANSLMRRWLSFSLLLFCSITQFATSAPGPGKTEKIFAGTWTGSRVQWFNGPPSWIRWLPDKRSGPLEVTVDESERHFLGFTMASRQGRTLLAQRVVSDRGQRWQETVKFTVATDGVTATFQSTSVLLDGAWKGASIENSAELHKVR